MVLTYYSMIPASLSATVRVVQQQSKGSLDVLDYHSMYHLELVPALGATLARLFPGSQWPFRLFR